MCLRLFSRQKLQEERMKLIRTNSHRYTQRLHVCELRAVCGMWYVVCVCVCVCV